MKVRANVTQRGSAYQRIRNRVQEHISVRVAQQPQVKGHVHAPEDEFSVCHQGMYIPAFANSKIHVCCL